MQAELISLLEGLNFGYWHIADARRLPDLGLLTGALPTFVPRTTPL
jgi:hypothetical protein